MTRDPVCYRDVDERIARQEGLQTCVAGAMFWFCSADCKSRFDQEPSAFTLRISQWEYEEQCTTENFLG